MSKRRYFIIPPEDEIDLPYESDHRWSHRGGIYDQDQGNALNLVCAENVPVTIPMDIQHATEEFEAFLITLRDRSSLATRNQTYTLLEAVFRTFRRRLRLVEAIRFAQALPPILRAIFIADWDLEAPVLPFGDRAAMTREAQSLRQHHNFAPDSCIEDVAAALRQHLDVAAFDHVLATLPYGAMQFWQT